MKKLETTFSKNGIDYETIKRTEKVGLFKLTLDNEHVGWEVARIIQNDARTIAGVDIEAGESIVGNEAFGSDGSKAFFPMYEEKANDYFDVFNAELDFKEDLKLANLP
jgi:hypothetical protein